MRMLTVAPRASHQACARAWARRRRRPRVLRRCFVSRWTAWWSCVVNISGHQQAGEGLVVGQPRQPCLARIGPELRGLAGERRRLPAVLLREEVRFEGREVDVPLGVILPVWHPELSNLVGLLRLLEALLE